VKKLIILATLFHTILLLGYKIISIYYPLFLEKNHFSYILIGENYLFIYFSVAIFSLILDKLINVENSPMMYLCFSFLGYAIYDIGMIITKTKALFLLWQIELGFSSALFYLVSRAILMRIKGMEKTSGFVYFYSAPIYGSFLAAIIGGYVMTYKGFYPLFLTSFFTFMVGIAITGTIYKKRLIYFEKVHVERNIIRSAKQFLKRCEKKYIFLIFVSLIYVGFIRAFFAIFLQKIGFSYSQIMDFVVANSGLSIFVSIIIAKVVKKMNNKSAIVIGTLIASFFFSLFQIMSLDKFLLCVLLFLFYNTGYLFVNSGKSGLIGEVIDNKEDAATIDTIIVSLEVAITAFIIGLLKSVFLSFKEIYSGIGLFCFLTALLFLIFDMPFSSRVF